jgi:hypothetical protein
MTAGLRHLAWRVSALETSEAIHASEVLYSAG